MPNILRYTQKILLVLIFLIVSPNCFGAVYFVNVGGPRAIKYYEISSFQQNTSDIKTVDLRLTHDINGKFYSYWITPILGKDRYINSASVLIECEPINLRVHQQDEVVSDDKKSIGFTFGISAELKKETKIIVTLTLDDNSRVTFDLDKDTEKTLVKEYYEGPGGVQQRAISSITDSLVATLSTKQTVFDLADGDEVDITFKVVNNTGKPVPYESIRDRTQLKINGEVLPESNFIFTNGIHPHAKMLPAGETYEFLYRLTRYFNKERIYTVSWRGDQFESPPIVFKVTRARKDNAGSD